MKSTNIITNEEVIDEWSNTDPRIKKELVKKGYKFLGSGVDQSAYLEPGTGYVLKIFGTQGYLEGQPERFSADHKMFFTWAKFCMKNADNPYLPKFYGYESFVFKNHNYLQIRQERLSDSGKLGNRVEDLGRILRYRSVASVLKDQEEFWIVRAREALTTALGSQDEFANLCKTIKALRKISSNRGWTWDLHYGNVMLRGTIPVIVDPWVV